MKTIELTTREIITLKGALYREAENYRNLLLKAKKPHQHEYYSDHLENIFRAYWKLQCAICGIGGNVYDNRMNWLEGWFDEYNQLEAALEV